jgi:hypothetical protein
MHPSPCMAHTLEQLWHDHAGARWLAPFAVAILAVMATVFVMMVWPYTST